MKNKYLKLYNNINSKHIKCISHLHTFIKLDSLITKVRDKYNLNISFDTYPSRCDIVYTLQSNESLTFTAWQIFEELDQLLNLSNITVSMYTGTKRYTIHSRYDNTLDIDFDVYFDSANCKIEYVDEIVKKAIVKCF